MHDEGMCNLIAAVINLAKKDYHRALINDAPGSEHNSKAALEHFFKSDWLQMLSLGRANPDVLIAQAKAGDYRG